MAIPENIIEEIKSRWREILPPDNSGKGVVCPICGNGSKGGDGDGLRETYTPNVLKCFNGSCDFSGDVIKAIQEAYHYTFREAVKYCTDKLGINYQDEKGDSYKSKPIPKPQTPPTAPRKRVPETNWMQNGFFKKAESHLEDTDYWKMRGLSLETAKRFKLGFVKDWINPKSELKIPSPRLIIPTSRFSYLARDTRIKLEGSAKRYSKMKVGQVRLFNANDALDKETAFVVEGEIDAMSICEVGYNALALGSTSNKKMLIDRLQNPEMNCSTKIFILALDNDEAGEKTSEWLESELKSLNFPCITANISGEYKDANEYLIADRDKFTAAVKAAEEKAIETLKNPEKTEANKEVVPIPSKTKTKTTTSAPVKAKTSKHDELTLEEKAAKLEEITKTLSSKKKSEMSQIALNYDTLRLADSVSNTEFHYVFADFKSRLKELKIISIKELETQIMIAAGRLKKHENGAIGEGRTTQSFITDCPLDLIIPTNFTFDEGGIFNHKYEVATHTPLIVSRIFKNLDENNLQKYEIQYRDAVSDRWHSLITEKSCLSDVKKIVGLSDTGLDVNSYSAKILIPFISEMVAKNKDIPTVNSYSRPGWKGDGFKEFICAPAGEGYILDSKSLKFDRIFTVKGDRGRWIDLHRKAVSHKYYRVTFGVFTLTPIKDHLNIRNSMIHLHGRSGGGKTAAIKLAVSSIADPKYYIQTLNATSNSIIETMIELTNHATVMDELQIVSKKGLEEISQLPYKIESGSNRKRLNKNANIKEGSDKTFSTIGITTGENPFTSISSEMGKKTRVLEYGGRLILPKDLAQEIHAVLEEGCHGHFYKDWIDYISDPNGRKEIKDCYQQVLEYGEVKDAFKMKNVTHRNLIAGSLTCAELFGTIAYDAQLELVMDRIIKNAIDFAKEIPDEIEITDTQRAIDAIQSVLGEREKHFIHDGAMLDDVKVTPIYGIIHTDPKDSYVGIYPGIFRSILEERGFNSDKIIKDFVECRIIKRRDSRHIVHYTKDKAPYYKLPFDKLLKN